jgi:hypothetical protein
VALTTTHVRIFISGEKKSYIQEIFRYRRLYSILVMNNTGPLERIDNPFEVVVIQNVVEPEKGLICLVNAVKMDLQLMDAYIIRHKAYYYFNLRE